MYKDVFANTFPDTRSDAPLVPTSLVCGWSTVAAVHSDTASRSGAFEPTDRAQQIQDRGRAESFTLRVFYQSSRTGGADDWACAATDACSLAIANIDLGTRTGDTVSGRLVPMVYRRITKSDLGPPQLTLQRRMPLLPPQFGLFTLTHLMLSSGFRLLCPLQRLLVLCLCVQEIPFCNLAPFLRLATATRFRFCPRSAVFEMPPKLQERGLSFQMRGVNRSMLWPSWERACVTNLCTSCDSGWCGDRCGCLPFIIMTSCSSHSLRQTGPQASKSLVDGVEPLVNRLQASPFEEFGALP